MRNSQKKIKAMINVFSYLAAVRGECLMVTPVPNGFFIIIYPVKVAKQSKRKPGYGLDFLPTTSLRGCDGLQLSLQRVTLGGDGRSLLAQLLLNGGKGLLRGDASGEVKSGDAHDFVLC